MGQNRPRECGRQDSESRKQAVSTRMIDGVARDDDKGRSGTRRTEQLYRRDTKQDLQVVHAAPSRTFFAENFALWPGRHKEHAARVLPADETAMFARVMTEPSEGSAEPIVVAAHCELGRVDLGFAAGQEIGNNAPRAACHGPAERAVAGVE